jgi:hypothetical protein
MDTLYCCSFCGKNRHEAKHMFTNQQARFCNECGDLCSKLMTEQRIAKAKQAGVNIAVLPRRENPKVWEMKPVRIQRKRTRDWRKPPNTVCVTRPGKWGNPFEVAVYGVSRSLELYQEWLNDPARFPDIKRPPPSIDEIGVELEGKNLGCYCGLDQPCHADVLLQLANS